MPVTQTLDLHASAQGSNPTGRATNTPAEPAPRAFGDYELLEPIGQGGMGVVYKAKQISLGRVVAVKTILAGQLATQDDVRRFYTGAEVAGSLNHPGIVPIYEVGEHEGQHFFSMGFCEGGSLAKRLADGPLPPREVAQLVQAVAEAIHVAHQRGLIHRDLKPANILLDQDGRPRVADFDLAKRVSRESTLTAAGEVLGTPCYMAPEQAQGRNDRIGPATDVYSLGVILYESLTGKVPFKAETTLDTLIQVMDVQPPPPRTLDANIPRDLETICLKCLQKDPQLRYQSAQELADDLGRFLRGDSIRASSVHLLDRVAWALAHSPYEEQFRGWGRALAAVGAVVFAEHVAMYGLARAGCGVLVGYWLPSAAMLAALLVILWRARPHSLLPTSTAERLVWAVWVGYLLARAATSLLWQLQGRPYTEVYAFSAVLNGLAFFAMGSHFWGGCYAIGLAFFSAAPLLARLAESAALWLGTLWFLALLAVAWRYWHVGWHGQHGRLPTREPPPATVSLAPERREPD